MSDYTKIDFTLPATGSTTFTLSEHLPCLIYFYPKDNTAGCTSEALDFKDLYDQFQQLGITIVGISRDSITSHEKFKAKFDFPFPLLSDEDETVCRQFGVIKLKKMYGRESLGIERSTFYIDRNGKIACEWRKLKVMGHVEEVLQKIREVSESEQ